MVILHSGKYVYFWWNNEIRKLVFTLQKISNQSLGEYDKSKVWEFPVQTELVYDQAFCSCRPTFGTWALRMNNALELASQSSRYFCQTRNPYHSYYYYHRHSWSYYYFFALIRRSKSKWRISHLQAQVQRIQAPWGMSITTWAQLISSCMVPWSKNQLPWSKNQLLSLPRKVPTSSLRQEKQLWLVVVESNFASYVPVVYRGR